MRGGEVSNKERFFYFYFTIFQGKDYEWSRVSKKWEMDNNEEGLESEWNGLKRTRKDKSELQRTRKDKSELKRTRKDKSELKRTRKDKSELQRTRKDKRVQKWR